MDLVVVVGWVGWGEEVEFFEFVKLSYVVFYRIMYVEEIYLYMYT